MFTRETEGCVVEGSSYDTAVRINDCCVYSVPQMTTAMSSVEEAKPQKMTGYDTVYQSPRRKAGVNWVLGTHTWVVGLCTKTRRNWEVVSPSREVTGIRTKSIPCSLSGVCHV